MCKIGDVVQIQKNNHSYVEDSKFIIINLEHNVDALELYHHIKYTLINYNTNETKIIVVWENKKISCYNIKKLKHTMKSYLYSLYHTLTN
jgi:hypothetical protein